VDLNCVCVKEDRSKAIMSPRMETVRAPSLRRRGIVRVGVERGRKLDMIRRPASMLPHARRLIGLEREGSFSLIGERGKNRGWPMATRKIMRVL